MTRTVRVSSLDSLHAEPSIIILDLITGELAIKAGLVKEGGEQTTLRLPLPTLSRTSAAALLTSLAPIAQQVLDGAQPTGHLNLPADEAYDEMGRRVAAAV